MRVIYTPSKIAEECFLKEALCWVAFQEYPIEILTENSISFRLDCEHQEEFEVNTQGTILDFMDDKTCERVGLPSSLVEEQVGNKTITNLELIDHLLISDNTEESEKVKLLEDRKYALNYHNIKSTFDEELDNLLDLNKHKLYVAIKSGVVKCYGRKVGELKKRTINNKEIDLFNDDNWKIEDEFPEFEQIPKDFLAFDGINWEDSNARLLSGYYIHIILDFNDVLKEFPEPVLNNLIKVYVLNDYLIPAEKDTSDAKILNVKRGRPSLDWDSFHVEVAYIIKNEEIPEKQESFINTMQLWCKKNWGVNVGRSTILQKVSPYYKKFKKSENSKK